MSQKYIEAIQAFSHHIVDSSRVHSNPNYIKEYVERLETGQDPVVRILSDLHQRAECEVLHDLTVFTRIYEEMEKE